MLVLQKWETW